MRRRAGPDVEHRFVCASHLRRTAAGTQIRRTGEVRILGLDPGLHLTGYGMIEATGPGLRVTEAGVIRTDPRAALADRLGELYSGLREVLAEWRPCLIALEDVFAHPAFPRTGILLGHVCGVISIAASERCIPVDAIPPAAVKRALVRSGRADKRQIQRMVRVLLTLERDPQSHVGDALALALVALSRRGIPLAPGGTLAPAPRPRAAGAPA
ncbi:MAG TPA: crossover junction endodeoxyribonuclease RuvC [bacterium]|nr:crossover junction endodeoxyribonuclease RuvC [bacterium]